MAQAIAKVEPKAVQHLYSLEELVVQINGHIYDANHAYARGNKLRLKAALKLLELRRRVEAGEAGDVTWWAWFEAQTHLLLRGRKDAEKLLKIAAAEDPEQAFDEEQERVRLAVAKNRERRLVTSNDPEIAKAHIFQDDTLEVADDVEDPAHVLANALDSISNAKSVAEAYRKIFKRSSFDDEAKAQLCDAIKQLIRKWRTVESTLERPKRR
jgi:hypothetical protein